MFMTKYSRTASPDTVFNTLGSCFGDVPEAHRLPRTNIQEVDKSYVLTMEMPGVEKKDIDVSIENDQITISAESSEAAESKEFIRREIRSAKFRRSFTLGDGIDRGKIVAKLDNGVLTVELPRSEKSVGRKVNID
jgi:HSP20 family protein